MSQAHFDVETVFDRVSKQPGTMTIDRQTGEIIIRPLHSRTTYNIRIDQAVTVLVQYISRQRAMENPRRRKLRVNRGLLRP